MTVENGKNLGRNMNGRNISCDSSRMSLPDHSCGLWINAMQPLFVHRHRDCVKYAKPNNWIRIEGLVLWLLTCWMSRTKSYQCNFKCQCRRYTPWSRSIRSSVKKKRDHKTKNVQSIVKNSVEWCHEQYKNRDQCQSEESWRLTGKKKKVFLNNDHKGQK